MRLSIATSLVLFAATLPAAAQGTLRVCIDGGQELPAVVTAASGQANVFADTVNDMVTVTGSYTNLSSNVTSVDLHRGTPITITNTILMSPTATGGTSGTFSGQSVLTNMETDAVYSGLTYINIRTTAHPTGEIRGQVAQRMTVYCPAELATDPFLGDTAGHPLYGPKIGHATEAFNVSLDCSNAPTAGMYLIVIKDRKTPAINTPYGTLWGRGVRLLRTTGVHAQSTVHFAPADVVVPPDVTLVGRQYTVQGFCGGRLSNAIVEVIGIGL